MRFSQADSTSSHAGTPLCCQPEKTHDIVILSFFDIVKGQAKWMTAKLVFNLRNKLTDDHAPIKSLHLCSIFSARVKWICIKRELAIVILSWITSNYLTQARAVN